MGSYGQQMAKFAVTVLYSQQNGRLESSYVFGSSLPDDEACRLQCFWIQQIWFDARYVLYETPDVEEALRRLPTQLIDERNFRITRALQYSGQKKYLAKEEWTKFDEDVRYLQPYLTEVIKERLEKEAWDRK